MPLLALRQTVEKCIWLLKIFVKAYWSAVTMSSPSIHLAKDDIQLAFLMGVGNWPNSSMVWQSRPKSHNMPPNKFVVGWPWICQHYCQFMVRITQPYKDDLQVYATKSRNPSLLELCHHPISVTGFHIWRKHLVSLRKQFSIYKFDMSCQLYTMTKVQLNFGGINCILLPNDSRKNKLSSTK